MPYCTNCGNAYQEESKFCQSCGHKFDSNSITIQRYRVEKWIGEYSYSGLSSLFRRPVSFSAELIFDGDKLSGNTKEHNTFSTQSEYMFATIDGSIYGDKVEFYKTYDGADGMRHKVHYKGTLDANAGKISGKWHLNLSSGSFEMRRVTPHHL
ncbi:MAG TPA: zinc ribbon domain-containing protein [Methanothrix sp.]|nr:zinc ribbon domain-containing protein [Methanothrix sp.]